MLVVRPGGDREKQGDDDMGTDFPSDTSSTSTPTLQRAKCHQIVGIDRDPEVGGRFQIDRGQPWNYSPDAFKN